MMAHLEDIRSRLIAGDHQAVAEMTRRAIDADRDPTEILSKALISGMNEIGRRFRDRQIFLPQVLLAARAMNFGMDVLTPHFTEGVMPTKGRIVLGTVKGDLHDIGKNLVGVMLKGAGYEVIDLGKNVAAEAFVSVALEQNARVVGLSALLTTTVGVMEEVIDRLEREAGKKAVITLVGGAPVTAEFARDIGADGYAFDAMSAVDTVERLLEEAR